MARSIASVLGGRRVEALKGGVQLALELSEGLLVTVDSDFRLTGASGVEHFYPGLTMEPSGGLLELIGARVTEAGTTLAGGLELVFDCGRTLSVPPDSTYQPWTVAGPDGPLFTALPGGYLTGPQP